MNKQSGQRLSDILSYIFMAVCFVFFAGPLFWLLSMALRTRKEAFLGVARLIPQAPTLDNFISVLTNASFLVYLWNGLVLSCISAAGVLIVSAPAAYAFSRFRLRGKPVWLLSILAFQMISPLVIMVPLYRYMSWLGLTDTQFAVIMVYIALGVPLGTWLLKGTMDAIPRALDEAAMIDGSSPFAIFWRVILPLSSPGLASVFIISVIAGWSQFLVPFLLISTDKKMPIAVGVFNYQGSSTDA